MTYYHVESVFCQLNKTNRRTCFGEDLPDSLLQIATTGPYVVAPVRCDPRCTCLIILAAIT